MNERTHDTNEQSSRTVLNILYMKSTQTSCLSSPNTHTIDDDDDDECNRTRAHMEKNAAGWSFDDDENNGLSAGYD